MSSNAERQALTHSNRSKSYLRMGKEAYILSGVLMVTGAVIGVSLAEEDTLTFVSPAMSFSGLFALGLAFRNDSLSVMHAQLAEEFAAASKVQAPVVVQLQTSPTIEGAHLEHISAQARLQ